MKKILLTTILATTFLANVNATSANKTLTLPIKELSGKQQKAYAKSIYPEMNYSVFSNLIAQKECSGSKGAVSYILSYVSNHMKFTSQKIKELLESNETKALSKAMFNHMITQAISATKSFANSQNKTEIIENFPIILEKIKLISWITTHFGNAEATAFINNFITILNKLKIASNFDSGVLSGLKRHAVPLVSKILNDLKLTLLSNNPQNINAYAEAIKKLATTTNNDEFKNGLTKLLQSFTKLQQNPNSSPNADATASSSEDDEGQSGSESEDDEGQSNPESEDDEGQSGSESANDEGQSNPESEDDEGQSGSESEDDGEEEASTPPQTLIVRQDGEKYTGALKKLIDDINGKTSNVIDTMKRMKGNGSISSISSEKSYNDTLVIRFNFDTQKFNNLKQDITDYINERNQQQRLFARRKNKNAGTPAYAEPTASSSSINSGYGTIIIKNMIDEGTEISLYTDDNNTATIVIKGPNVDSINNDLQALVDLENMPDEVPDDEKLAAEEVRLLEQLNKLSNDDNNEDTPRITTLNDSSDQSFL